MIRLLKQSDAKAGTPWHAGGGSFGPWPVVYRGEGFDLWETSSPFHPEFTLLSAANHRRTFPCVYEALAFAFGALAGTLQ